MIENPFTASGPVGGAEGGVEIGVDVEADDVGGPFDSEDVEVVGEVLASGEGENRGEVAGVRGGARAVQGAVEFAGFLADVFHNVDFTALGPAYGGDVFSEHPEGGPHALAFGDFDAGFDATVGLGEEALRFQAGGSVVAGDAVGGGVDFLLRGDDEIAFFDVGVFGAVGIGLEFVIAPTFAAQVVSPFGGIGRGTVGRGEFIAPD